MTRTKLPLLEGWCCKSPPYVAPELGAVYLEGYVYGHPSHRDGARIATSQLTGAVGRVATTRTRRYELGEPEPGYRKWLEENRPGWDPENPIKVIGTAGHA